MSNKIPKDLGVKFGTEDDVYWTAVKGTTKIEISRMEVSLEQMEKGIKDLENQIKFHRAILETAERKLKK